MNPSKEHFFHSTIAAKSILLHVKKCIPVIVTALNEDGIAKKLTNFNNVALPVSVAIDGSSHDSH